ncbi:MAG: hypothetical protein AAF489_16705 [Bacteroidota bacterium]
MKWYNYLAAFFAGLFLANFIPHFIQGITGVSFPTPFSDPPGKGLSPAYVNLLWAFFNLTAGYFLLKAGKISRANKPAIVVCILGFIIMSFLLSYGFSHR